MSLSNALQKAMIDLENNFQMPGQHALEKFQGPGLESLRQKRVIRIGERIARDLPGGVPIQKVFVQQQAHQLGHRNCRVGIVELNHELVVQTRYILSTLSDNPNCILQCACDEE